MKIEFDFKINKSFLDGINHPITIPRKSYDDSDETILKRFKQLSVITHRGRKTEGLLYFGVAGYGQYYQIRMLKRIDDTLFSDLNVGDIVFITLTIEDDVLTVRMKKGSLLDNLFESKSLW